MDPMLDKILASDLPGDVRSAIVDYMVAERDPSRRAEFLRLVDEYVSIQDGEVRSMGTAAVEVAQGAASGMAKADQAANAVARRLLDQAASAAGIEAIRKLIKEA